MIQLVNDLNTFFDNFKQRVYNVVTCQVQFVDSTAEDGEDEKDDNDDD